MTKLMSLSEAVSRFVQPGYDLHFASTPSRSNAAVLEVARQFRGKNPSFCISATGFHSTLHLLTMLGLAAKLRGCFFGDHYPTPRPNPLYGRVEAQGVVIEPWSLWSYVSALRAGACGHPYAVTRSLASSSLGDDLARAGRYFETQDPADGSRRIGLLAALRPDISFLHAAAADSSGRVLCSAPFSEGFHGALAAKHGVVVTVERVLDDSETLRYPHLVALPSHRVLAVCEAPFGAHPQSLHFAPESPNVTCYGDDYEQYRYWRELPADPHAFADFERSVLSQDDVLAAYRAFIGASRFERLKAPRRRLAAAPGGLATVSDGQELTATEHLVLAAARTIVRRIDSAGYQSILAGIGSSFAATRLACGLLAARGRQTLPMVETGFAGFDVADADGYLLSQSNVASASYLSSVDIVLGALTCGSGGDCVGVIGAAQVDAAGNVNSSREGGQLLVGSGGANDIASAAGEVIVLARSERLVRRVEYVTSPGHRVRCIVTDQGVLQRSRADAPWLMDELGPRGVELLERLRRADFSVELASEDRRQPPSELERSLLLAQRSRIRDRTEGGAA